MRPNRHRFPYRVFLSRRVFFNFCEIIPAPACPASERTGLLRIAIFNDGRAYGNYVNFARRDFFFLNIPSSWCSAASVIVSMDLRYAAKAKFRFRNFIKGDLLLEAIAKELLSSKFEQIDFRAYLFTHRVHARLLFYEELSLMTRSKCAPRSLKRA